MKSRWCATWVATLALSACVSTLPGDREFEAGNYAAAAASYRSALAKGALKEVDEVRSRYRLAIIYNLSDSPLYNPAKATALFEELTEEHPRSPYAKQAEIILEFQSLLGSLRGEILTRQERVSVLLRELTRLKRGMEELEGEVGTKSERIESLNSQVSALKQQVQELSDEVSQRERELQRLKEIDLAGPPR